MVEIHRIQVEEGFLDGLNLVFSPGLNVIIGPRGSGKTSIIELIRFCLKVEAFTEESNKRAVRHAKEVLGSGRVTLTFKDSEETVTVSRSAEEDTPRSSLAIPAVTILSQNEIESLGKHPQGRLRIIDDFISHPVSTAQRLTYLESQIRSIQTQLRDQSLDLSELEDQVFGLASLQNELESALSEQREFLKRAEKTSPQQKELEELSVQGSHTSGTRTLLDQGRKSLEAWRARVL